MSTYSPAPHNNPLIELEGTPTDVNTRGVQLQQLGQQMESTATSLRRISDGTTQISDAVDTLRESAGEIHSDLTNASVRYEKTGDALVAYAEALEIAKTDVNSLYDPIEQALERVRTAQSNVSDARRTVNDFDRTWIWEEEPTDQQVQTAQSDLSSANTSLTNAEDDLEDLWRDYDRGFNAWESAYDTAVADIEDAMDLAGNDDNAWDDFLDDFMQVLGWVLVALTIAAFIFAPIAGVLLAIAAVLTVVSLLANLYRVSKGRASWLDVGLDVIGLIPFVRPAAQALRGGGGFFRGFSGLLGTGAAASAIGTARSKLTHYLTQGVSQANRGPVFSQIDDLMRPVAGNWLQRGAGSLWNTIRGGDRFTGQMLGVQQNVVNGMAGFADLRRALSASGSTAMMPGAGQQAFNVVGTVLGVGDHPAQQFIPGYGEFRSDFLVPDAIW